MANLLSTVVLCLSVIAVTKAASVIQRPESGTLFNTPPRTQLTENEMVDDLLPIQQLSSLNDADFLGLLLKYYDPQYETVSAKTLESNASSATKQSGEQVEKRYPMGHFTSMASNIKDKEATLKLAKHLAGNVGQNSPCLDEMIPRVQTVHDLLEVFRLCR